MRDLIQSAADRAVEYLTNIGRQPVFPPPTAVEDLADFSKALQDRPLDPQEVLAELDRYG